MDWRYEYTDARSVDRTCKKEVILLLPVGSYFQSLRWCCNLPKLKLIAITATGTNNVDLIAAKELGITVKNVTGYSSVTVPVSMS